MRLIVKIGAGFALAGTLAFVGVFLWFSSKLEDPKPAPVPTDVRTEVRMEDQTSTIFIPVSGSLKYFENILNTDIPWRLANIDEPRQICLKTKSKLVPDISCELIGQVDRGRIRLTGSGRTLKITVPVSTQVQARDIGGIVKRETVTGSVIVTMRLKLSLSQDWQPSAKVDVAYDWGTKLGIDFLGQRINFSSKVDPEIRKIATQIEQQLPKLIAGLNARQKAQRIWAAGFTSERVKSNPEIWVRFTPQQVGYAGYLLRNGRLIVSLAAVAKTETIFGGRPEDAKVTPLPNLMPTLPPKGISVHAPFHIPYSVFQRPVEKALALGAFQEVELEDGTTAQARFNDVEIFGIDRGRIAIGIGLTLKEPVWWLGNVDGKIWLTARPSLDLNNKIIGISNLEVISRTDNRLFDTIVGAVSKKEIDAEVVRKISYNFATDYDDALEKADQWLSAEPLEGFVFRGNLISAELERVHILPEGLIVQAQARGDGRMYYAPGEAASLVQKRRQRRMEKKHRHTIEK